MVSKVKIVHVIIITTLTGNKTFKQPFPEKRALQSGGVRCGFRLARIPARRSDNQETPKVVNIFEILSHRLFG